MRAVLKEKNGHEFDLTLSEEQQKEVESVGVIILQDDNYRLKERHEAILGFQAR